MGTQDLANEVASQLLGLGAADDAANIKTLNNSAVKFGVTPTPSVIKFANSFAATKLKALVSNSNLTRDQKIFAMKASELPEQSLKDLRDGTSKANDGERYVAAIIANAAG